MIPFQFLNYFSGTMVLVTGGLGFIGSNLVRTLVQLGAQVTVVDKLEPDSGANPFNLNNLPQEVRVIRASIDDDQQLTPIVKDHQYIFNLAGLTSHLRSMLDPFADLQVNAAAQLKLL